MNRITVDGIEFRAVKEFGGWYESDDPTPSGTVGRLMMPMFSDGTPDIDNLGEIEVSYEDA